MLANSWSFTGSLPPGYGRVSSTATLLTNGQVLVVGGYDKDNGALAVAELYNPATGTFSPTGSLNTARYRHTATLLNNGEVLIAGGVGGQYATPPNSPLSSAELYDPSTGQFTVTGSLPCACFPVATLLNTGMVLFSGGFNGSNAVSTAELYDPKSGKFVSTGSLNVARSDPSSTLLSNGQVLIAGGVYYTGTPPLQSRRELPGERRTVRPVHRNLRPHRQPEHRTRRPDRYPAGKWRHPDGRRRK